MQYRSISRLIFLNIVTLGIYEAVWLAHTRNEMVTKYGVVIPRSRLLYFFEGLQGILILSAFIVIFVFIPYFNNQVTLHNNQVSPAEQNHCVQEQIGSDESVSHGGPATITPRCQQVVSIWADDTPENHLMYSLYYVGAVAVLLNASGWFLIRKWYTPYAKGVERVTNGAMNASTARNLLWLSPPAIKMAYFQGCFNRTSTAKNAQ